jgi:hypothetical protein
MFRLSTVFLFSLAAAGIVACDGNDATGPEVPADQVDQPASVEAENPGDQPEAQVPAGSLAITATRLPKSFFVNPTSGKDTNPGTKLKPFKTLARALGVTIAKDTVRLVSGLYSAATNGEKFTNASQQVVVPAGVMILGTLTTDPSSSTRLQGSGAEIGLNLKGGGTVRNLILTGFVTGIRATQGVQSLKRLVLDQNIVGLELSGSAKATLVTSKVVLKPPFGGFATGSRVSEQAQFIMDGGIMTVGAPNCALGMTGVELQDAGRATLKNSAALTYIAGEALDMRGTSKATLTGNATIDRDLPVGCLPSPSVLTLNSASLTLQSARILSHGGNFATGIESQSTAPLTLTGATLSGHSGEALRVVQNLNLAVSGSTFSENKTGIDASNVTSGIITISSSIISKNTIGIKAPFFKLRNSQVILNQVGVESTEPITDLGQIGEPGNNTISGNSLTGVRFSVGVSSGPAGTIFAAGNNWNPSTQGSDQSGQYPDNPLVNGSSPDATGKNFALPTGNSNFQIQL